MKKLFAILILSGVILGACTKDKVNPVIEEISIDEELYLMAKNYSDSIWFAGVDSLFQKSSGSGHNYPFLKVKYNSIAGTVLDSSGRVYSDTTFPEGSLIFKDLYDDSIAIGRYAVMFKDSDHMYADATGWVWGYIEADGTIASAASNKGGSCITCHNQTGSVNGTLMNKFYP